MNTRTFFKSLAVLALSPMALFAAKPKPEVLAIPTITYDSIGGHSISGYAWSYAIPDGVKLSEDQTWTIYKEVSLAIDRIIKSNTAASAPVPPIIQEMRDRHGGRGRDQFFSGGWHAKMPEGVHLDWKHCHQLFTQIDAIIAKHIPLS